MRVRTVNDRNKIKKQRDGSVDQQANAGSWLSRKIKGSLQQNFEPHKNFTWLRYRADSVRNSAFKLRVCHKSSQKSMFLFT